MGGNLSKLKWPRIRATASSSSQTSTSTQTESPQATQTQSPSPDEATVPSSPSSTRSTASEKMRVAEHLEKEISLTELNELLIHYERGFTPVPAEDTNTDLSSPSADTDEDAASSSENKGENVAAVSGDIGEAVAESSEVTAKDAGSSSSYVREYVASTSGDKDEPGASTSGIRPKTRTGSRHKRQGRRRTHRKRAVTIVPDPFCTAVHSRHHSKVCSSCAKATAVITSRATKKELEKLAKKPNISLIFRCGYCNYINSHQPAVAFHEREKHCIEVHIAKILTKQSRERQNPK